jgi:hypothetical protein
MNHTEPPIRPSLKLIVNRYAIQRGNQVFAANKPAVMSNDDIYIDYLLHGTGMNLLNPELQYFLVAVLSQTEVRQILTLSVVVKGATAGPRIAQLLPIAKRFQQMTFFSAAEREAIYVATILHGIEYWLKPCVQGSTTVRDVMATIVQDALRRLDRENSKASQALRLCMGWGNVDEESALTQWLEERMHSAISALDQSQI